MGYLGKGKKNINTNALAEKHEYLKLRGKRLSWTVSKFAGAIIDDWFRRGCPIVHDAEYGMPKLPYQGPME